jgi:hypothetical protein
MALQHSPSVVTSGIVVNLDAANPKSFSPNTHPYPLAVGPWAVPGGSYQGTTSSDTTVSKSPAGGIPLKFVTSGVSAYIGTYNSSTWNITPAVSGQTWTVSFWVKGSGAFQGSMLIFEANSSGTYLTYGQPYYNITTEWTRVTGTYTTSNASCAYLQVRFDCYNSGVTVWYDGLQVEKASSASTFNPRANANTAVWADLNGNSYNANLLPTSSPPTYNSSGYLTYNGTSNESLIANPGALIRFTVEAWAYPTSYSGTGCLISDSYPGTTSLINYCIIGQGQWQGGIYQAGWYYSPTMAWDLNTWQQVVYTFDGTNQTIYKNGVSGGSTTTYAGTPGNSTVGIKIGRRWDIADFWGGRVSNIKIYNRALSAAEVLQNFNALRGRYGL